MSTSLSLDLTVVAGASFSVVVVVVAVVASSVTTGNSSRLAMSITLGSLLVVGILI